MNEWGRSQTIDFSRTLDVALLPRLPPAIEDAVKTFRGLASLGSVARRQLAVLQSPNSSVPDIEQALESDLCVSMRLLQLVNQRSPVEGRKVSDIHEAIRILGRKDVLAIVLAAFQGPLFETGDRVASMLWLHSYAVASLSRLLALRKLICDPQQAFAAGLLHDVGSFLMYQMFPERYASVFEEGSRDGWNMHPKEVAAFGVDHLQMGAAISAQAGLGEMLHTPILLHHHLDSLGSTVGRLEVRNAVVTVALADELVHRHLRADGVIDSVPSLVPSKALEMYALNDVELLDLWSDFRSVVTETRILLGP